MRILISNDDGVHAPGIAALAKALTPFAEVWTVAPDRDRSGASNSLTLKHPMRVRQIDARVFAVEGTPTDCVHMAITGLLKIDFDMVISGINDGSNLGDDVLYSGTVAAATEGRFLGLPSIAISLAHWKSGEFPRRHFDTAANFIARIMPYLKSNPLPPETFLNINVPNRPISDLKGVAVTRLGTRHRAEPTIESVDPRGYKIYWVGPPGPEQDAGEGTDFHAVTNGKVSITPLQFDLTHHAGLADLNTWLQGFE